MSVIVELALPADEFELGRILSVESGSRVVLETMVPLGGRAMPFFRLFGHDRQGFLERVRDHDAVAEIQQVSTEDGQALYALDWDVRDDPFFDSVLVTDGHVMEATGTGWEWAFELRFPSHEALSEFRSRCVDADVEPEVKRVYNPTKPDAGPWYGLTAPQRETLSRAVQDGYYSIPRQVSTNELAAQFDVSDQAVTERLRRAIDTLVEHTLLATDEEQ